jgi:BASS family bile acid:Na+ symporter
MSDNTDNLILNWENRLVNAVISFLKYLDEHFWIFLLSSIFLGLYFPNQVRPFEGYVIYIIMLIMGILFLKVDIVDIITHIKQPATLIYVAFINLIVSPVIVYFVFKSFAPNYIVGLTLLAALPAGVTSAAFTDIMKGRTCLSVTIILVTNLLCVFTIPFLFWTLFKADLNIDYLGLFINLLKVFLIPFFIAKVLKHVIISSFVSKMQSYYNIIIIMLLSFMIMISIAYQADFLLTNIPLLIQPICILFGLFVLLQFIGYFSVSWLNKGEKIAVSNSNMIMNNILGIVLSIAFFTENPEITFIVILSLIPWNLMIMLKHWYKRFLP